jgi:hypothetical protein
MATDAAQAVYQDSQLGENPRAIGAHGPAGTDHQPFERRSETLATFLQPEPTRALATRYFSLAASRAAVAGHHRRAVTRAVVDVGRSQPGDGRAALRDTPSAVGLGCAPDRPGRRLGRGQAQPGDSTWNRPPRLGDAHTGPECELRDRESLVYVLRRLDLEIPVQGDQAPINATKPAYGVCRELRFGRHCSRGRTRYPTCAGRMVRPAAWAPQVTQTRSKTAASPTLSSWRSRRTLSVPHASQRQPRNSRHFDAMATSRVQASRPGDGRQGGRCIIQRAR